MALPRNIYSFGIAGLGALGTKPTAMKPDAAGNCPAGYTRKVIGYGKGQPGTVTCVQSGTTVPTAPTKALPALQVQAQVKPGAQPSAPAQTVTTASIIPGGSMTLPLAAAALVGVGLLVFLRSRR